MEYLSNMASGGGSVVLTGRLFHLQTTTWASLDVEQSSPYIPPLQLPTPVDNRLVSVRHLWLTAIFYSLEPSFVNTKNHWFLTKICITVIPFLCPYYVFTPITRKLTPILVWCEFGQIGSVVLTLELSYELADIFWKPLCCVRVTTPKRIILCPPKIQNRFLTITLHYHRPGVL